MKYKNGEESKPGDVIRWNCWDNDDCTMWTFTGLVIRSGVVYLGGGIDFGMGIGQKMTEDEVIEEQENNDPNDRGIERIGSASDLASHIHRFK